MSYVRWGEAGSNVYVIEADGGYQCVGCDLPDSFTPDLEKFITHLERHKELGHEVPAWLENSMRNPEAVQR